MLFCNSYSSKSESSPKDKDLYGSDPYDVNCSVPLNLAVLENERIKLTPLIPRFHAKEFYEQIRDHPEIHQHLLFPFPSSERDICALFEFIRKNPGDIVFAIHDKSRPSDEFDFALSGGGSFAGTVALADTSLYNLSTEIGVFIFADYQRTHVHTNAAGLLLNYCLNLPSDPVSPGLGLRRVQWVTDGANVRSIIASERLGFRKEGTLRWHRALPAGREGAKPREGDPAGEREGRHSEMLSLCWDDWIGGAREKLALLMAIP